MRWKYGNYEFRINPNSHQERISMTGDTVRTLSGAQISQPTGMMEEYQIQSVFYQPRTRVVSEISVENATSLKLYNNRFYVLNKNSNRIDVYNQNFNRVSTISLSSISNKNFVTIGINSGRIWVVSESDGDSDSVYRINSSGEVLFTGTIPKRALTEGIAEGFGYVWVLRSNGTINRFNTDLTNMQTIRLPSGLYYNGLSIHGDYLAVGNNDDDAGRIYHVERSRGQVINMAYSDRLKHIGDITNDDGYFYSLDTSEGKIQKVDVNTVDLDIYHLKKEISTTSYVFLTDDMGVSNRVQATSFSKDRVIEHENMYKVSMNISKIDVAY